MKLYRKKVMRWITVNLANEQHSVQDVYKSRFITNNSALMVKWLPVSGVMEKERELMGCKTLYSEQVNMRNFCISLFTALSRTIELRQKKIILGAFSCFWKTIIKKRSPFYKLILTFWMFLAFCFNKSMVYEEMFEQVLGATLRTVPQRKGCFCHAHKWLPKRVDFYTLFS